MNLREIMNEKKDWNEQEKLIEEQSQMIQEQLLKMQEMQSELMKSNEMIELLKSRATKVNKIEIENKRLSEEKKEALISSSRSKDRAEKCLYHAELSLNKSKEAEQREIQAIKERIRVEADYRKIKADLERLKSTYKRVFIFNGIFTLILVFLSYYGKFDVFTGILNWLPGIANNIKSFF